MAKHIHMIGICGSAMASLAGMLQTKGYRITGSDAAAYPPMSDLLASLGIPIMEPYEEANLSPRPDLVIVGNAISRGNVELESVLDQRIPFRSLAETIQHEFLPGRDSLVVAGTHGKTTTTSMLAWIYEVASRAKPEVAPSFLIGGIAENFGTSFRVRDSKPFILEGDEYDTAFFDKGPKFMHYFPDALILTHVEFDHADIYDNLGAVKTAFRRLVNLVPRRGRVIAYDGSPNVDECVARALCAIEHYGFKPGSAWQLQGFNPQPSQLELEDFSLQQGVAPGNPAHARGAQCPECHRGCGPGCGAGNRSGCDRGGSVYLSKCEAQARSAGCCRRGHDCRRFRPSPDGDSGDVESFARRLSRSETLGGARATIEHAAQKRV